MMEDRELLELAAKAAGLKILGGFDFGDRPGCDVLDQSRASGTRWWSPLTDDGDAFRLAVKLHMATERVVGSKAAGWMADQRVEQVDTGDPYETLRRAIVKAAANIGKSME